MYSANIKDSFVNEEEYWDLVPKNYCMFYNITFLFPLGKRVIYAKLFKKDKDEQGSDVLKEIDGIAPVIVTENSRAKMILQIVDYDYGDYLCLKWKLG